ncbi:MAG: phosphate/phosphite/phosphonate ABC transporter substrate-binding protein [Armatimonadota bacterium]|nr:phosphate/phosphite/phosphonate ABC transporter substrate-binding protein [Armatimonadota bacterium]MDR5696696.1 phosphate/phosphite/phosphonate ABC transporter substrate-binding protein [Armatimonadota bacterium]
MRVLLIALVLVLSLGLAAGGQARRKLVLAFVPSLDAQAVLASGKTLERMLAVATGYEFEATVPTSYAATIEAMCAGRADIAFLAPLSYVLARQRCGAEVKLISIRFNQPHYGAQILVGADTGIRRLADLRGKRFAYSDPASTSGYLYPAVHIKNAGFDPNRFFSQTVFAGGHDKVVLAIYQGQVDGGATFGDEFGSDARDRVVRQFPDVKQKVVVLEYVKPYIPNDTVSFRRGLDPEVVDRVTKAMFRIAQTSSGKQAIHDLYQHDGYATYEDLVTKYGVDRRRFPDLDSYFNPIRDAVRTLGIDLGRLVR